MGKYINNAESCKAYKIKIKLKIFALFNNKCTKCGFSDIRALQLDHIFGAPEKQQENMRGGSSLYCAILAGKKNIKDFQLLCANCNWIKRFENNEHSNYKNTEMDILNAYHRLTKIVPPEIAIKMIETIKKR